MGGLKRRKSAPHRRVKRKRTNAPRRRTHQVSREIVPKTLTRVFRYSDNFVITPALLGVAKEVPFLANGMFDPFVGLGGHQPYGFDQWMSWYDHFTVVKAKVTVHYCMTNPGSDAAGTCLLRLDDDGVALTNAQHILEMPGTKSSMIGGGSATRTLTKSFNARRFFGGASKVGSTNYKGSVAADPAEKAYFNIGFLSNQLGTISPVAVTVMIEYTAVLSERKEVPQS